MRVLVATIVNDPRDARVYAREITALLDAGHEVTYIAPFRDHGLKGLPGVTPVNVPAARGRRRLAAARAARRALHRLAPAHDLVLIHSPELLVAAWDLRHPCIVWDVHEDTAAALSLKGWLPRPLRRPMASAIRAIEGRVEWRWHILLAEESYQDRFDRRHPIVPNSTPVPAHVPEPGIDRVVYVGHVTRARGGFTLLDMVPLLPGGTTLHVVGHADDDVLPALRAAAERGDIVWHGFLPNAQALEVVQGAAAGLSLLADEPNYRHSRPTKIMEYLAQGVPVITTPLPAAVEMIERSGGGVVVPFDDASAAAQAVWSLVDDSGSRSAMAHSGRAWVSENADWTRDGPRFVSVLRSWAQPGDGAPSVGDQGAGDPA